MNNSIFTTSDLFYPFLQQIDRVTMYNLCTVSREVHAAVRTNVRRLACENPRWLLRLYCPQKNECEISVPSELYNQRVSLECTRLPLPFECLTIAFGSHESLSIVGLALNGLIRCIKNSYNNNLIELLNPFVLNLKEKYLKLEEEEPECVKNSKETNRFLKNFSLDLEEDFRDRNGNLPSEWKQNVEILSSRLLRGEIIDEKCCAILQSSLEKGINTHFKILVLCNFLIQTSSSSVCGSILHWSSHILMSLRSRSSFLDVNQIRILDGAERKILKSVWEVISRFQVEAGDRGRDREKRFKAFMAFGFVINVLICFFIIRSFF